MGLTIKHILTAVTLTVASSAALAAEHVIEMKNSGDDGAMVFEPGFLKAEPGDTVKFVLTNQAHNSVSVEVPEGAEGWQFDITVVRAGDQVYRLLTAAPVASTQLDSVAATVGGSFKLLSAQEKAALKPLRIRIVTVQPGQTTGAIAAQMVGVDRKLDLFRVLNALAPGASVSAGDKVKIVTDR